MTGTDTHAGTHTSAGTGPTRVSVVIPVLNDARLLENCLAALAIQTRTADEIIVVDNGCTDDSMDVALRYRAHGVRIIAEPRPGVTAASATGFDAATGAIIARCDADSRVPRDWIERIVASFGARPDAVAVTGPADFYALPRGRNAVARILYLSSYFVSMRVLLGNNVLFGSNCALRADAWRHVSAGVPRTDPEIHDDMDLSYRLPAGSTVLHDRTLVVGISARPLRNAAAIGRRLRRAAHTFSLHLPAQLPHRRWAMRLRTRRRTDRFDGDAHPPLVGVSITPAG